MVPFVVIKPRKQHGLAKHHFKIARLPNKSQQHNTYPSPNSHIPTQIAYFCHQQPKTINPWIKM